MHDLAHVLHVILYFPLVIIIVSRRFMNLHRNSFVTPDRSYKNIVDITAHGCLGSPYKHTATPASHARDFLQPTYGRANVGDASAFSLAAATDYLGSGY